MLVYRNRPWNGAPLDVTDHHSSDSCAYALWKSKAINVQTVPFRKEKNMKSKGRFYLLKFVFTALLLFSALAVSAVKFSTSASAASCPTTCGSYTISGLGSRKQQVLKAGASTLDLAVAMEETSTMQANYTYGDGKSYDAANFGIFKQNWLMLRSACSRFSGQSASQYNNGAVLNSNLSADVSCIKQSQSHYGLTKWFGGHRDGSTGLNNPNTKDINNYKNAIYWIQSQLTSGHLSDNTRFWVNIPAI
jgi:hypothetical protein